MKVIAGVVIVGASLVGGAFTAAAEVLPDPPPGYDDNPGRLRAIEVGAQCGTGAGSGAFGAFIGQGNNQAGGTDGYQTGLNNSAICGNR